MGLFILIMWVACAYLSGSIAANKNRNVVGYTLAGFLFGLLGVLAAVIADPLPADEALAARAQTPMSLRK